MKQIRLVAAVLCVAAFAFAFASSAGARAKPKPVYSIKYTQTYTSKTVSANCPIPTGGTTTTTTTSREDYTETGRFPGTLREKDTQRMGAKQEVSGSDIVQPSDDQGQPQTTTRSQPAKDAIEIRKGRLMFTRPGYDDPHVLKVKVPADKGDRVSRPVGDHKSTGPEQSSDGCTNSDRSDLVGKLTVERVK